MDRVNRVINQLTVNNTSSNGNLSFPNYTCIKVTTDGRVGTVTLHRPEALNALNDTLIAEVGDAFQRMEKPDSGIGIYRIDQNRID